MERCSVFSYSYEYSQISKLDILVSFIILAVCCFGLAFYEHHIQNTMSHDLFNDFYFQEWDSELMMQTVNIHVLREKGLLSFYYLHIQPPVFDFVRYVLSFDWRDQSDVADGKILDGRIYLFYCFIYGGFNQLIYLWSRALGFHTTVALLFAILWAIYPGNLAIATLLEGTYLSAFLNAWAIFSLYLYLRRPTVSGLVFFLGIFLVGSWTRTLFQFPLFVLLVVIVVFFIFLFHRENWVKASIIALPLAIAFLFLPLKQQYLYGTLATTTFAGQHEVEGVWYRPSGEEIEAIEVPTNYIENAHQLDSKYNSPEQVVINYRYEKLFRRILISKPAQVLYGIEHSLLQGMREVRIPTQNYRPNKLIEVLPWAGLSRILSGWMSYLAIIIVGCFGYLLSIYYGLTDFRGRYLIIVGFIGLEFATIVLGSNRYGWTEAERLKFIVEAPLLLFSLHGIRLLFQTSHIMIYARSGDTSLCNVCGWRDAP